MPASIRHKYPAVRKTIETIAEAAFGPDWRTLTANDRDLENNHAISCRGNVISWSDTFVWCRIIGKINDLAPCVPAIHKFKDGVLDCTRHCLDGQWHDPAIGVPSFREYNEDGTVRRELHFIAGKHLPKEEAETYLREAGLSRARSAIARYCDPDVAAVGMSEPQIAQPSTNRKNAIAHNP